MKGKILGSGIISGDDGNRYNFEVADIANLDNRNPDNLAGYEVDFEINENMAKSIFITGGGNSINMDINEIQGKLMANDVSGIRFKFLLSIGLYVLGSIIALIPFIGWVLGPIIYISGYVVLFLAVIGLKRASESKTLLRNLVFSFVIIFIVVAIAFAIAGSALIDGFDRFDSYDSAAGTGLIVTAIICLVGLIIAIVFYVLYSRELAFITGQKFLIWSVYVNILGALTTAIFIGYLLLIVAFILNIVGFWKFSEIRKRTDSDVMPWF